MKFSKFTVIILLLLLVAIVFEFNYLQKKIGKSHIEPGLTSPATKEKESDHISIQEENRTQEQNTTHDTTHDTTQKKIRTKIRTNQEILDTVVSYQQGYQEGCSRESRETTESNRTLRDERAFLLGLEKGKKDCPAQIKEKNPAKPTQNKTENPDYQKGYQHGCSASQGNGNRDENSYLRSKVYRAGWTEGRKACKQKIKNTPKTTGRSKASRDFDQGYFDGCDTATRYFRRDRYKYDRNPNYRRGWERGEYECGREQRMAPSFPPPAFGF